MPVAIMGILTHRADVARMTVTNENGLATKAWADVALNQPILLTAPHMSKRTPIHEPEPVGSQTNDTTREQRSHGTVFCMPDSPIQPADRLTIRVPGRPPARYVVLSHPSHVDTPTGPSHREMAVTAIP